MDYGKEIAKRALEIGAIKLNPENPFTWASGFRMPIYNDNRMHLWYPKNRKSIMDGFLDLFSKHGFYTENSYDFIAGTSTSGIPWATILAENRIKPLVYIRDKPKDHGLKNRIEGIDTDSDLKGLNGILIEDLISTGGSSVSAVQAIRDANGQCNHCLSIFTYGFPNPQKMFNGELAYNKEGHKLATPCNTLSILDYKTLLEAAAEMKLFDERNLSILKEWESDPFNWGQKHGSPPVERK
jgi:orotate phosphoribosyltransferase